jgi:hypothetical protein
MPERRTPGDRRSETRHPEAGRVSWRRAASGPNHVGWLSDASESSVSFVTAAAHQPAYGEEVEVIRRDRSRQRVRVRRVATYDGQLALVACRRDRQRLDGSGQLTSPAETPFDRVRSVGR